MSSSLRTEELEGASRMYLQRSTTSERYKRAERRWRRRWRSVAVEISLAVFRSLFLPTLIMRARRAAGNRTQPQSRLAGPMRGSLYSPMPLGGFSARKLGKHKGGENREMPRAAAGGTTRRNRHYPKLRDRNVVFPRLGTSNMLTQPSPTPGYVSECRGHALFFFGQ